MSVQPMNAYFAQMYDQWKKTGKKKYQIWCTKAAAGITVHNFLEHNDYTVTEQKNIVLSGTLGEQWTTTFDNLAKTYHFANGDIITPEILEQRVNDSLSGWLKIETNSEYLNNYAMRLDPTYYRNVAIQTGWGEILMANTVEDQKVGICDYLVCRMDMNGLPDFSDMWVVDGRVFAATYNMQAFNVLPFERNILVRKAPQPSKDLRMKNTIKAIFKNLSCLACSGNIPWREIKPSSLKPESAEFLTRAKNKPHILLQNKNNSTDYYIVLEDLSYVTLAAFDDSGLVCSDVCRLKLEFKDSNDFILYLVEKGILEAGQALPRGWEYIDFSRRC